MKIEDKILWGPTELKEFVENKCFKHIFIAYFINNTLLTIVVE